MVNVWGKLQPGAGAGGMYRKKAGQWRQIGVDPATAVNWAQVTGGTVTEYTKGDGSVMEVHTFTATGSSLTVVAAGYAEVLLVGGGSQGVSSPWGPGAGGAWNTGLFPLPTGVLPVTLGAITAGGTYEGSTGKPTSLGPFRTNYSPLWPPAAYTPLTSSISGTPTEYSRSNQTPPIRANSGDGSSISGASGALGIVIVAVQKTPPTASGVVATGGTETTYVGDGTNGVLGQTYKVHTFTASGSLVVTQGGDCEVFLISGGSGNMTSAGYKAPGGGGDIVRGPHTLSPGSVAVVVGAGGTGGAAGNYTRYGGPSSLGSLTTAIGRSSTGAGGTAGSDANAALGFTSRISGAAVEYGKALVAAPVANRGEGGPVGDSAATNGSSGVVIVRYKV